MRFGSRRAFSITVLMTSRERESIASSRRRYAAMSAIGCRATPERMAASATAGATQRSTRWSKGFGIRYSRPKRNDCPPYALETESGTSILASAASACEAARFMGSLISVARTSSAPRKMNGKPRTLLTWLG